MLKAQYFPYRLKFNFLAGTSRGILKTKLTYFITLSDGVKFGIGECSLFKGLSYDDNSDYENELIEVISKLENEVSISVIIEDLKEWPSIQFGIETAFLSFKADNPFYLFDNNFSNQLSGIEINGLVWMGDWEFMYNQLKEKLELGHSCIKIKIGAINFEKELDLLKKIRNEFSEKEVEIRLDANGAFSPKIVVEKLKSLAKYKIHSIEQPIRTKQIKEMKLLCENPIIPIALDEELIGVVDIQKKESLLREIKPQYIILKPALVGGFTGCNEWINLAKSVDINWWITSALESNIGLNAIAQYVASKNNTMPQGLGTGGLFSNNISSPLELRKNRLWYGNSKWDLSLLNL